jgi:hypothetical protein
MKAVLLIALCLVLCGCATVQHHSALKTVRIADATLSTETTAAGFERRLTYLGATIESGSTPASARVATFLTPASPSHFPPRRARIVYKVTDDGMVQLEGAAILPLVIVDHAKA